eukprot:15060165-Alexandrium_andersonii.AAC.1
MPCKESGAGAQGPAPWGRGPNSTRGRDGPRSGQGAKFGAPQAQKRLLRFRAKRGASGARS